MLDPARALMPGRLHPARSDLPHKTPEGYLLLDLTQFRKSLQTCTIRKEKKHRACHKKASWVVQQLQMFFRVMYNREKSAMLVLELC